MTDHRDTRFGAETAVDARPFEADDEKAARRGKELEAFVDASERRHREQHDRKNDHAERVPRIRALASMAKETIGRRGNDTTSRRLRELRADPTFQSLPPAKRAAWEQLAGDVDETAQGGDYRTVWTSIDKLADEQASSLGEWDPHEANREANDPTALADMIPRGAGLAPRRRPE